MTVLKNNNTPIDTPAFNTYLSQYDNLSTNELYKENRTLYHQLEKENTLCKTPGYHPLEKYITTYFGWSRSEIKQKDITYYYHLKYTKHLSSIPKGIDRFNILQDLKSGKRV